MSSLLSKNITEEKKGDTLPPVDPKTEKNKVLFIADCDPTEKIRVNLSYNTSNNVLCEYDFETFLNRDLNYFTNLDINHIWVNLFKKKSRSWLSSVLNNCDDWKIITIQEKKNDKQKFVDDLKDFSDLILSINDIDKIKALTIGEMSQKINNIIHITKPRVFLKKLLVCGKQEK